MSLIAAIIGFMFAGVSLEVFWTSILNYKKKKDNRLVGCSYLWMFPIYALAPFIYVLLYASLSNHPLFVRGIFYMSAIYLLEYVSGYTIKKIIGRCPWDYSKHGIKIFGRKIKTNLDGIICLEYAPIFYIYGILGEFYFLFLH